MDLQFFCAEIVSYRLSTVKNADNIYVLDAGRVAESGSHSELMKRKGLYHDLVAAQAVLGEEIEKDEDIREGSNVKAMVPASPTPMTPRRNPSWRRRSARLLKKLASIAADIGEDDGGGGSDLDDGVVGVVGPRMGSVTRASMRRRRRRQERNSEERVIVSAPKPVQEDVKPVGLLRILRTNASEWPYMVGGVLSSLIIGGWMPVYAVLYGEVLEPQFIPKTSA